MKVEWQGGWAELSERLTHGRRMRIIRVMDYGQEDSSPAEKYQFGAEVAAAHITAWSLGNVDPVAGPPAADLDALPSDGFDALLVAAFGLWTGRADPNASTPSSDVGLSDSA